MLEFERTLCNNVDQLRVLTSFNQYQLLEITQHIFWNYRFTLFKMRVSNPKPKIFIHQKFQILNNLPFSTFYDTPNLKWKKLSNNSSWDFEHVLDTMDDYWVGPDENFCPESTPTRWRCNHFSKKWSKSKFDATLSIKKPFVTPKFCGRNFSQMHHFEDMNFLSPIEPLYSSSSL